MSRGAARRQGARRLRRELAALLLEVLLGTAALACGDPREAAQAAIPDAAQARAGADTSRTGAQAGFPHEPGGFRTVSTWDWPAHEGGGWRWEGPNPVTGAYQEVVDGSASPPPSGGAQVLQATYVAGSPAGSGAGRTFFPLRADEVFVGYWMRFDPDYRASDNPGGNKMFFLITDPTRLFLAFRDIPTDRPRRNYNVYMSGFGPAPGNETWASPPYSIPLGAWHKVELHYRRSHEGARDGVLRIWVDDVQRFGFTDLDNPHAVTNLYFEGTHNGEYIGGERRIPTSMHWQVGRVHVSVPRG